MKQSAVFVGGLVLVLGYAARSSADGMTFSLDEVNGDVSDAHAKGGGVSIESSLDGLRWGMSKSALLAVLKNRIRADFDKKVKVERDIVRQDGLYQEAKQRYERVRDGFIAFDGRKTGWDVSPLVEEFRHGSNESMLVADGDQAREHYFFINDRLWKWYRELKPAAWGGAGANFTSMDARLRADFGAKPKPQKSRLDGQGEPLQGSMFEDDQTRVTLMKRGAETCLIYEQRATLEQLSVLRARALPRGPKQNGALDQILMTPAQRETWREQQDQIAQRKTAQARQTAAE